MYKALTLSGCGTMITVPIDQTLIEEDKATIILFTNKALQMSLKFILIESLLVSLRQKHL